MGLDKKTKSERILKCSSNDCEACVGLCKSCWDDNENLKQLMTKLLENGSDDADLTLDVQEATVAFLKIRKEVPDSQQVGLWEALSEPKVRVFLKNRTARKVMRNVTTPKEHWLTNSKVIAELTNPTSRLSHPSLQCESGIRSLQTEN